jgi:Patatin-like phospholipase
MASVAGTPDPGPALGFTSGRGDVREAPLRLGLSLPGGIAPGTFEAGAVCGLLSWIQALNALQADTVVVDVIAGASAGALTGLLTARVLIAGDDPVSVLRQAWVTAPSLRALRGRGSWAPLSLRPARAVAHSLIFASSQPDSRPRQGSPVTLNIALGCLRGFTRELPPDPPSDSSQSVLYAEYLDWSSYTLGRVPDDDGSEAERWTQAIDSAMASASHPVAFRARALDRSAERSDYLNSGVTNLPAHEEDLRLWYTDGGLLDNEPLGRCVDSVAEIDGGRSASRLVMLVRSGARWPPSANSRAWSGQGRPRWIQTLARVLDIIATQAAGRDLLQVEEINAQLVWAKEVAARIAERIGEDEQTQAHFRHLLSDIDEGRRAFDRVRRRPVARADPGNGSVAELVEAILKSASGLTGRQLVEVAVITPDDEFPGPQPLNSLVAFIERRQREDNFAAGYWTMLRWIESAQTLEARVAPDLISRALVGAGRKVRQPSARRLARDRARGLSIKARWQLLRLAVRTSRIARADLDSIADRRESTRKQPRAGHRAKRLGASRHRSWRRSRS